MDKERIVSDRLQGEEIDLEEDISINEASISEEEKELRDIVSQDSSPESIFNLARYLERNERYDEAIGWYKKAMDKKHSEAYTALGMLFMELGRVEEADKVFKARSLLQLTDVASWVTVIKKQLADSQVDIAMKSLKEAFQQVPNDSELWHLLGRALFVKGKTKKAQQAVERAIEYKEDHSEAWALLGRILVKRGKKKDALRAFHRVVELKPKDSMAWSNLGVSLAETGRNDEARKAFQKAADLDIDNAVAWKNLATLNKIEGQVIDSGGKADSTKELDEFLRE